jgi:hypothetical protein
VDPILTINKDTGVTDVALDPKSPDVMRGHVPAPAQRRSDDRRRPDGGIFKSKDGGKTWAS